MASESDKFKIQSACKRYEMDVQAKKNEEARRMQDFITGVSNAVEGIKDTFKAALKKIIPSSTKAPEKKDAPPKPHRQGGYSPMDETRDNMGLPLPKE